MLKDRIFGITNPYTRYGRIPNPAKRHSFRHLLLLLSPILLSCMGGTVFHCYKPLPAEGWERSDTVCFDIPKAEADIDGSLFIGLRTAAHVGMRDIVLVVEQCGEGAVVARRDTIRYLLNDAEGNALAPGVNYHQYENLQTSFHLRKGKDASVRIHHLMTHEVIPGIMEVGIRIEE